MKVLVTGAAGFIGFHLANRLLHEKHEVIGIDNLNEYYDPKLKRDRLAILKEIPKFTFHLIDLEDRQYIPELFLNAGYDVVVHLAAQAGVRYSIENPLAYIDANLLGFANILEGCRAAKVPHLVYASSSSVYGANTLMPFSVNQNVDHPVSLYAATKKANELMAHAYASLYGLASTGLRFFTVYGPWGRPDMALFKFAKSILEGSAIDVYNHGNMKRDFTFIDDIVESVTRIMKVVPQADLSWNGVRPDPATSYAPYRLYNIGGSNPIGLMRFIELLEDALGKKARKNLLPLQMGDVVATYADVHDLEEQIDFRPRVTLEEGIQYFVDWFRSYYSV